MSKQLVYIASPFRAATAHGRYANILYAQAACKAALDEGVAPIAPHLYLPQVLDDGNVDERRIGLDAGLAILAKCDELWAFTNLGVSDGMIAEIDAAKAAGKRVLMRGVPGWDGED